MGMMDGYMKGVAMMGGFAQPRQRMQPVSDNHDEVIELLKEKKAWRSYAVTLKASLDAEKQVEADVIKALQEVSPNHPLVSEEVLKEKRNEYYQAIPNDAACAKADEGVKKYK